MLLLFKSGCSILQRPQNGQKRIEEVRIWISMNVQFVDIFMIQKRETLTLELNQEHLSRTYPTTGYALCVGQQKRISKR